VRDRVIYMNYIYNNGILGTASPLKYMLLTTEVVNTNLKGKG
jgi:hypothetical protein